MEYVKVLDLMNCIKRNSHREMSELKISGHEYLQLFLGDGIGDVFRSGSYLVIPLILFVDFDGLLNFQTCSYIGKWSRKSRMFW